MVEGQLHRRERLSAILTLVIVPRQDVLARQDLGAMRHLAVLLKPDHRGKHDAGVDFAAGVILNHSSFLDDQHERATRSADVQRFIAGVQDQYRAVHYVPHCASFLEQRTGIEPVTSRYECDALPTTPSLQTGAENGTRTRVTRVAL